MTWWRATEGADRRPAQLMAILFAVFGLAVLEASTAHADQRFDHQSVDVAAVDLLSAIVAIDDAMDANRAWHYCGSSRLYTWARGVSAESVASQPAVTSIRATGRRLIYECSDGAAGEYVYSNFAYLTGARSQTIHIWTPDGVDASWFYISSREARPAFAAAWLALGLRREIRDPTNDAEFLASLPSASSVVDRAEDLRRVQVQVEAAVRANRTIDAARLYRETLRITPAWVEGHFNLGLLYGELELYPEAITEMQRYLYLTPNAPDARAVQDRIYEWEAALAR